MRHVVWFLFAVAALVAGCSRSSQEAAEGDRDSVVTAPPAVVEAPADRPRVVFLGDSLTAGYGLPKEQAVPSLIQKRLEAEGYDYEVVNHGVSGDTSAGGVSRLDWSLTGDVRVLVIELGGNDGLRGLPVETTRANLSQIISRAKDRGITVLLTGMEAPPNHGALYTKEFRQTFHDLAREYEVAFVPFYLEGVAGVPALNLPDGIHPNAEGSLIVEQTIWKALVPLLEEARLKAPASAPSAPARPRRGRGEGGSTTTNP